MINLHFEFEGLDEMGGEVAAKAADLRRDLRAATYSAAKQGVEAAQAKHPYTDRTHMLTGTAHPGRADDGDAFMFWPMEYGSYVDEGTSRSRPYPFTPIAEYAAESTLNRKAEDAVDDFCRAVEGR